MPLDPKRDAEREQELAGAIESLRKSKQFIMFTSDSEPGSKENDEIHFVVCGDLDFVLWCSSHMSRHAMAVCLVPEMMGVEYIGEEEES